MYGKQFHVDKEEQPPYQQNQHSDCKDTLEREPVVRERQTLAMAVALPDCYHPGLTKKECENLLGKKAKDGAFLLRDSETTKGALCLCVYKQNVVYTYRVLNLAGLYYLPAVEDVKEEFFSSLKELISHYRQPGQGLAIRLGSSIKEWTPPLCKSRPPPNEEETVYENSYRTYVTVLPP